MSGRSIFDITDQNFGRLDETIQVANDNSVSLNDEVTEDLIIGDYEGDVKKKDAIALQKLTFNNVFEEPEEEPTGVVGLLDFDGVDDYVSYASVPDVTGNKTITFPIYVQSSIDGATNGFYFRNNNTDFFSFYSEYEAGEANPILLLITTNNNSEANGSAFVYISSEYLDKQIDISITKTSGLVTSLSVNGIPQTLTFSSGADDPIPQYYVGAYNDSVGGLQFFSGILIWNIEITGVFTADGQPEGNLAPAWSQSLAATVNGNPTTIDLP